MISHHRERERDQVVKERSPAIPAVAALKAGTPDRRKRASRTSQSLRQSEKCEFNWYLMEQR